MVLFESMARKKTSLALEGAKNDMTSSTTPQGIEEIHKKLELVVLAKRLSSWESKFVDFMMIGLKPEEALAKSGFNLEVFGGDQKAIEKFADKTLRNYDVQKYMQSALDMYKFQAPKAISTILGIMLNEQVKTETRLDAAKFIATEANKAGEEGGGLPTKLVLKFVKEGEEEKVIEGDLVKQTATIPPLKINTP